MPFIIKRVFVDVCLLMVRAEKNGVSTQFGCPSVERESLSRVSVVGLTLATLRQHDSALAPHPQVAPQPLVVTSLVL